jgi:bifunctional enzyme CysN/CysC
VRRDFGEFAAKLGVRDLAYVPVSALQGDNVVRKSRQMRWYDGPALLTHLETLYIAGDTNLIDLRFPVQLVTRAASGFRGYAGQVASGVVRAGDEVLALPSGRPARVKRIITAGGETDYAFAPQAATLCLDDDVDLGRGDMLVHPANLPRLTQEVEAIVVWMDDRPLEIGRQYIVKHTTNAVKAEFASVSYKIDPDELHRRPAAGLALNEVGRALVRLRRPIMCDEYSRNRRTGSFIIIDPDSNNTAGAGMIIERSRHKGAQPRQSARGERPPCGAPDEKRRALLRQEPVTLWLTGLSGSGKSAVARAVEDRLVREGHLACVLDGDRVRLGLNSDLGFSPDDRRENIRRAAEVARLFNDAGLIVITSFISPYAADRAAARRAIGERRFVEVFVDAPIETCESRDSKGLYEKARSGEIPDFTGVSAPYEAPEAPEIHLHTDTAGVEECVEAIMRFVRAKGFLGD